MNLIKLVFNMIWLMANQKNFICRLLKNSSDEMLIHPLETIFGVLI